MPESTSTVPAAGEGAHKSSSGLLGPTSNLIIACAGAGILAFPYAMMEAGVILGIFCSVVLMILNTYSNHILVRMSAPIFKHHPEFDEALKRTKTLKGGELLVDEAGDSIRVFSIVDLFHIRLGENYGVAASVCLFVGTIGALIGFLIIIADILVPVLHQYGPDDSFTTGRVFVTLIFVVFVACPLSTVPDLESLTISSIIAVATVAFVALVVVIESFSHDFFHNLSVMHIQPRTSSSVLTAISIMMFAFACSVQVVPVMGEMPWVIEGNKTIKDMYTCVTRTMVICASLYTIVGVWGYVQFGSDTDGVILDDYSCKNVFANIGRFAMVLHVALAYPVILYPAQQNVLNAFLLPIYNRYYTNSKSAPSANAGGDLESNCKGEGGKGQSSSSSATGDVKDRTWMESDITTGSTTTSILHIDRPRGSSTTSNNASGDRARGSSNASNVGSVPSSQPAVLIEMKLSPNNSPRQTTTSIHSLSDALIGMDLRRMSEDEIEAFEHAPAEIPVAPLALRIFSSMAVALFTSIVAILVPQAAIVFGLMGSMVASTLIFIMPGLLALKCECSGHAGKTNPHLQRDKIWAYGLLGLGIVVAIGGTFLNILSLVNTY